MIAIPAIMRQTIVARHSNMVPRLWNSFFGAVFLFQTGKSAAISLFCAVVDENLFRFFPKLL